MRAGRASGLEIAGLQLFAVESCDWVSPGSDGLDGLLIGSANALRHAGPQLARLQSVPVYAVGKTTADVARAQGFAIARVGTGGLQGLIDALDSKPRHLLRLAGEVHLPLALPPHLEVTTRVVYRSQPTKIQEKDRAVFDGALVLLHSGAAAEHFAGECDRLGIDRSRIALAALGPRIAEAAGAGWRAVGIAPRPDDAALLALARDMCQ